ncbi:hypothetical protein PMKS-002045 [Pichia membranifaciens]|uniref:Ribosomal RNA-processing protein 14/surfeit locus protein 6 C-terminal domain-containing protein n=1 Tax=Pichia membranifaciens TaxID=4926 RepID=A0A1Q2YGB5_9ASCO|nr:hypothetical protein PMKS-002045 [Pichia membranifaciens]
MGNSLEERLQQHSNSFDGLMSLIPAKYYYDAETSNQWQQKRKSKQEHQTLKRRKLDPESNKNLTAKDVLKETEKTATPVILPGEKLKMHQQALAKKEQEDGDSEEDEDEDEDHDDDDDDEEMESDEERKAQAHSQDKAPKNIKDKDEELLQENVTIVFDDNGEELVGTFKKEELQQQQKQQQKAKTGKKTLSKEEQEERERKHRELKAKLQAKIQSMREKRKAPGTKAPGAATSRQQILEERRKKAELKKELKRKDAESSDDDDDDNDDDDAENGEGEGTQDGSGVMFGNIEFLDGERVSSDLTSSRKVGKKKGPSNKDIKGHLKKIEREKSRLGELDNDAKKKLEDKSKWQKALASVQGIKVKDDEKLLKKALRRKESKKRKSEREWKDRIQTVADEKKMKSDRREENLRIRKANKGKGRKEQVKQLPSYKRSRANKKMPGGAKRAGFEGGIRSHKKK